MNKLVNSFCILFLLNLNPKVKINPYNRELMNTFDKMGLYFLLLFCLAGPLVGQEDQKFSVLLSNYFSATFQKEDSFFQPHGVYGNGVEVRYKVGDNNEEIKTFIGLTYYQLNYNFSGDLPPSATTKKRHQIISLPMYLWLNISEDWYMHYHLSFDIPFRTKEKHFDGNQLLSKSTNNHKIRVNAGLGAGIALGHYFEIEENYRLFGELFFKAPSLLSPLSSDEDFYIEQGFRPYIIGLNIGIRF